jgi:hypothetical protein
MLGEIVSWAGDLAIGPLNFLFPLLAALTSLGVVGFTFNWRKGRLSTVTNPEFSPRRLQTLNPHPETLYRKPQILYMYTLWHILTSSIPPTG